VFELQTQAHPTSVSESSLLRSPKASEGEGGALGEAEARKRGNTVPTLPDGKEGAHRLSSRFTEWMMGLPEGWVTSADLTRNEELRACGNGVVPQQAELALRMLLEGVDLHADS
jgi:hypothetical protein